MARPSAANAPCDYKLLNIWVSRIIPLVLVGIVGYVTWVFVALICVNYLLHPSQTIPHGPRHGAAIPLLMFYFILMCLMSITYFRLLYTVVTNPGFVPRGINWRLTTSSDEKRPYSPAMKKRGSSDEQEPGSIESNGGANAVPAPSGKDAILTSPGGAPFYTRDVYVCSDDGIPYWCSTCQNFKPDRAHHCSEVDRCVRKMDHFCPWVGGIVSLTTHKFFLQFTFYALIYCIYVLVVIAVYLAEKSRDTGNRPPATWCVALGFAAMFMLFTAGMVLSNTQLAVRNLTTIESLSHNGRTYTLAFFIPETHPEHPLNRPSAFAIHSPETSASTASPPPSSSPNTATPTGPLTDQNADHDANANTNTSNPPPSPFRTVTFPNPSNPSAAPRTFALLTTPPSTNPWDLSSPLANLKTVLGENYLDWFLPIKYGPCTLGYGVGGGNGSGRRNGVGRGDKAVEGEREEDVGFMEGEFEFGPLVQEMRRDLLLGRHPQPQTQSPPDSQTHPLQGVRRVWTSAGWTTRPTDPKDGAPRTGGERPDGEEPEGEHEGEKLDSSSREVLKLRMRRKKKRRLHQPRRGTAGVENGDNSHNGSGDGDGTGDGNPTAHRER